MPDRTQRMRTAVIFTAQRRYGQLHGCGPHGARCAAGTSGVPQENAAAMAEFYEALARSPSFDGTGIAHPFLPTAGPATDEPAGPA